MVETAVSSGWSSRTRTSPGAPSTAASRKITRSAEAMSSTSSAVRTCRAMTRTPSGRGPVARESAARGPMASSPRMGLP